MLKLPFGDSGSSVDLPGTAPVHMLTPKLVTFCNCNSGTLRDAFTYLEIDLGNEWVVVYWLGKN